MLTAAAALIIAETLKQLAFYKRNKDCLSFQCCRYEGFDKRAAFLDPNPVVMLEHKGLYWSKVPGTEDAKTIEPAADYIIPLGKANIILQADKAAVENGETCCIITYGMGVYWAKAAAKNFAGKIEVIDLRTLFPLDEALIFASVQKHGKCLIVTEEQQNNSFAEALAGRISKACFKYLDAPVEVLGALNLPAVPMNIILEKKCYPMQTRLPKESGNCLQIKKALFQELLVSGSRKLSNQIVVDFISFNKL